MVSVNTQRLRGTNSSAAIKVACIAASTGNLTLSAEQTVDGVALVDGDRCLAKDQTDATEIGIYKVSTGAWVREPDFNGSFDVVEGTLMPVSRGTANADTYWRITNTGTIVVDTTSITIAQGLTDVAISATSTITDESADTTCFVIYVDTATGNLALHTGSNLTFNSNTGAMGFDSAVISSNVTVAGTFASSGAVTLSTDATIGGTLGVTGTVTASSNAVVAGTLTSSGTVTASSNATISETATLSSNIIASLLTTSLSGTDPSVSGQVWVSTAAGSGGAGKVLVVSTGA